MGDDVADVVISSKVPLFVPYNDVVISSNLSATLSFPSSFFRYNDVGDVVSHALLLALCKVIKHPIQMCMMLRNNAWETMSPTSLYPQIYLLRFLFYPSFFRYNDVGDVVSHALLLALCKGAKCYFKCGMMLCKNAWETTSPTSLF